MTLLIKSPVYRLNPKSGKKAKKKTFLMIDRMYHLDFFYCTQIQFMSTWVCVYFKIYDIV